MLTISLDPAMTRMRCIAFQMPLLHLTYVPPVAENEALNLNALNLSADPLVNLKVPKLEELVMVD
jgi:hypothetical protein